MIKKVSESYKHHILIIALGPFLKIIEAIFDLLIPLFMKAIIDLSQYSSPSDIPNAISSSLASFIRLVNPVGEGISDAITGGIIILVMGIVGYVITMVSQYLAAKASVGVGTEVRSSLYQKLLQLSKKEREEISTAKLMTVINSDTYQLQKGVLYFVRLAVRAPFILVGALIFSFILDWRVGLAYLAIVPMILLVNFLVLRKSSKGYLEIQSELDNISNQTSETVEGARVIRASNNQENEYIKFSNKTETYQNKSIKVNRLNALINPLTFAITSIVLIVIILLLRNDLFGPNNVLVASTIIAEMSYLAQIFFVVVQFSIVIVDVVKASVSRKRIDSVLTIKPQIVNISNPKVGAIKDNEPVIKFDHVSFSFDESKNNYFLNDLDFEIRKGETFAIIGGTGSGKSTIINLIERFYDASKGNILYKGIPLKEYDLTSLRRDIGLVNQKSSLFKGTIKSNYLMSNPNASDEDIINALKNAQAYEFVSKYDDFINHEVNEGATNFSGGQKQRLCIGRALVRHPELLILDDATSALDLLTDKRIRDYVSSIKDMTKVIVSQRVATVQNADYILVLEGGKVVGQGKHEDLLKTCPIYLEIYQTQIKKE
jgi:ATP-binding cassette subfamily B protein